MVHRVVATEATLALIAELKAEHGEMMFHQSGGCCDGSAPNCFLPNEIMIGAQDIKLGEIGGVPFYISKSQYGYWKHTQLIIDVIKGQGGNFSLESATGKGFLTRSRLFTEDEWDFIEKQVEEDLK